MMRKVQIIDSGDNEFLKVNWFINLISKKKMIQCGKKVIIEAENL